MTIIVEDGTALPTANSYASETDGDTYTDDRGLTAWTDSTGDKEAALIRATASLDMIYRTQYPGIRLNGRLQGLEWPRSDATDFNGNTIAIDEIPQEIIYATIELAIRELAEAGSTMPDRDRAIRSVKAGSVSVDFAANATTGTVFSIIGGIMASLIGTGGSSRLFAEASRG